ncbi:LOW QUALITY PROTEIN: hypothetical protein HID58_057808 [Brassica napus]|uniref:Uncharacterized protein n=1 Tax=Brassica napus TaxID=3708 RepID=A0ABQ7XHZ5_BRANA|nr:LOW QUALITY PROTEIN: hypothetical protein HID58_057808 [Brassica napus]
MGVNNTKSVKRNVVDQLVEGYESATQLQLLLSRQQSSHHIDQTRIVSGDPDPVNKLMGKILDSFHKTISVLDSFDQVANVSVVLEGSRNTSCGDDSTPVSCNGGDSGDSRKRLGVGKSKRGCYTRKKRSHTWTVEARRIDEIYMLGGNMDKSRFLTPSSQEVTLDAHTSQHKDAMQQSKFRNMSKTLLCFKSLTLATIHVTDETQAKTEPLDLEIDHVDPYIQEQGNDISSLIGVGASMVKEEDYNNGDQNNDYCEGSSTYSDLSLVWPDVMMSDDRQHHQNHFYHGEASTTTSYQFSFIDNDQFSSLFDSYCSYEGTSAI